MSYLLFVEIQINCYKQSVKSKNSLFFKGLPSYTRASDRLEAHDAEVSVYGWWWRFLRLSPVIWFAQSRNVLPKDNQIAQVVKDFGDLKGRSFHAWWSASGRYLFAEAVRPSKVLQLDLDQMQGHQFDPDKLYLEIPLTIRKQTILKQIKTMLNEHHEGRELDLAATSSAEYALYTKRFRLRVLETEYWVLLYRLLYPEITVWRIGDRLQLAPSLKVRGVENMAHDGRNTPMSKLNSLTGRYLYKARFTLLNAERAMFPNNSAVELGDRHQPFGMKLQTEFRRATESIDGHQSEWHQWLKTEFQTELRMKIQELNRIVTFASMSPKDFARIKRFISGESDLLY